MPSGPRSAYHGLESDGEDENFRNKDKKDHRRGLMQRDRKRRALTLEELYERHGENLYRYLLFRLGSAEDAEDVLQESFCRFARYDLRRRLVRAPRAFMFRVARNEANRFLRSKIGQREGERMIATDAGGGFATAFAVPEEPTLAFLMARADGLPGEQKEVVFLKVFDGLTFKEIGSVCGISANTAASRYRYGIEKLREAWGEKS
jgi:RNA polymerase sigma-70 factor (ECF subfamily)